MADTRQPNTNVQMRELQERSVINPRRTCLARVTVVALCVCLSVCLLPLILSPRIVLAPTRHTKRFSMTRERFKKGNFVKTFRSKVMA